MVAGSLGTMHAGVTPAPRGAAQELWVWPHRASPALVSSQALWGYGPNPALGCMGDVPLHRRGGTCLSTPHLPWWDFGLKPGCSRGARLAPGCCSCQRLHAMLGPGAAGSATEQLWGQAAQCPGAQPTHVPQGQACCPPCGGVALPQGGPIPALALLGGLPQKSLSHRVIAVEDCVPNSPSVPATFGCPPTAPCSLHSPIPQVELSWGGGKRRSQDREKEPEEGEQGEEEQEEGCEGGRAGYQTSYEKPRGSKPAVSYKIGS